jgi:uncharacterized protein
LILIFTKLKSLLNAATRSDFRLNFKTTFLLFVVGVWAGFIVLDSGTYMLLVLVLAAGLTLVEANAIKNFVTLLATLAAMFVFVAHQSVDWKIGGLMGVGSLIGGLLGARVAVSEHARRWIVGLLVVVIVGELVHLAVPLQWLDKDIRPAVDVFSAAHFARSQDVTRLRG